MDTSSAQNTASAPVMPQLPCPVTLTEKAVQTVRSTIESENLQGSGLRISVKGGGCAGYQYSLDLEKEASAEDMIFEQDGIQMFIDPMSVQYLAGAQVDFVETAYASGFSFSNPQAKSTCGCGSSFSA